jgi:type IV secretion system protein VirD4
MTLRHRLNAGNKIIRINPFNVNGLGSDGFNPIAALRLTKEFPDDAKQLSEAVIRVPESKDPHWARAAQELITALIMYVRLVIPGGSFVDVRQLLGGRDEAGWRALVRGGLDTDPVKFAKWQKTPPDKRDPRYRPPVFYNGKLYPGMIAAATDRKWPQIETKIARFGSITPENRELHGVLAEASVQIGWLDSPSVQDDLRKNPFDFRVIRDRPTTVYLMLPANRLETHSAWMRLMVASIVQKLMKDTRPPTVPVLLMLDEYYALAEGDGFPAIKRNFAMFRGYGIKLWTVWQDLGQAKELYGDSYETFVNNAGIVQSFACQDDFSSSFLSKLTGQTTLRVRTMSESRNPNPGAPMGVNISRTAGVNLIPRALILPHEIRNMRPGHSLIFSDQIRDGTVIRSYVPWPGDVRSLRHIMRLDPGRAA